jgi:hypothetical protein
MASNDRMIVNNELETDWKEAVMAKLRYYPEFALRY